jgi:glycyl-tRNA synthetase beta chain
MGRIYAHVQNEPDSVAAAIEEHYRPAYAGGPLPETVEGAVLAIADKIDSICGCFSIGLIPTGASDPYGLRRHANGIIQIALDRQFAFSLTGLVRESLNFFGPKEDAERTVQADKIIDFLKGRMAHLLEEDGIARDVVAAVLAASDDNIQTIWQKAHGLQKLKTAPDFEVLAIAFKRVVNIIRKADAAETIGKQVDIALFEENAETDLFKMYQAVEKKVRDHIETGNIDQAFADIAAMRETVDRFFDDVMVMADDARVRQNRLALLGRMSGLFALLADFSKIST